MSDQTSILKRWGISEAELTELVDSNPSLRGILLGYVAEHKFHTAYMSHPDITTPVKDDDHNRKKKGDRRAIYKGTEVVIEVKSLQTIKVKKLGDDEWTGGAQVDASDRRTVHFPDGSTLETTCLLRGEFDILAVNCFAYGDKWRFAFALNADLPQNRYKKYTEYQRKYLLPTLIRVEWPLVPPFTEDLSELLKRVQDAKKRLPATLPDTS